MAVTLTGSRMTVKAAETSGASWCAGSSMTSDGDAERVALGFSFQVSMSLLDVHGGLKLAPRGDQHVRCSSLKDFKNSKNRMLKC
jgi:hypothetical protein